MNSMKLQELYNTGIFQDNIYFKWYAELILSRIDRPWSKFETERHHYIPKSIIPNNDLINLSIREHYVAHLLLTKAVLPEYQNKMIYSLSLMKGRNKINSRLFEKLKIRGNKIRSERMKGRVFSDVHKENIRKGHIGLSFKMMPGVHVGEKNPMYGIKHKEESKLLMSQVKIEKGSSKGEKNAMYGVHRMGKSAPNHGKIWINNGKDRKMINKTEEMPDGFSLGYGKKPKKNSSG